MNKVKAMTIYITLCIAVGILAKSRGRSGIGWAFLAFLTTPLLAGGAVFLMKSGNGMRHPLA